MRVQKVLSLVVVFLLVIMGCAEETLTPPDASPLASAGKALSTPATSPDTIVPGQYIVMFNDVQNPTSTLVENLARHNAFIVDHIYTSALSGFVAHMTPAVAQELSQDPSVMMVEPDRRVTALAQTLSTGADRIEAELSPIAHIDGQPTLVDVDIAIIDSGVDVLHEDLNVSGGTSIIGGLTDSDFSDDFGHGTHLAGIIGARDNGIGIVGVAPGARIWGVKVLDGWGLGLLSDVIAGLDWVTNHAGTIEIATLSLGTRGHSLAFQTAVQNCIQSGVVVFAAAGNDAGDIFGPDGVFGTDDDIMPAAFPEVATISALADADGQPGGVGGSTTYGTDDSFASFSNFATSVLPGNPVISSGGAIDLILPGVDILSTIPADRYDSASGTSMAAAFGAGLAALQIAAGDRAHNANEVYALRQALVDNAVSQYAPQGLFIQNDRDAQPEPLGWAIPSQPYADVAIIEFSGPEYVEQGNPLNLTVTVGNLGTVTAAGPVTVTLIDMNSGLILRQRTLASLTTGSLPQATVTLSVPADFAPGFYTLKCSHDFSDPVAANNSQEITVEVRPGINNDETLGLYFDESGTLDHYSAQYLEYVTAYVVYNYPTTPEMSGFECGLDIQYPFAGIQSASQLSISYPIPASDAGQNDPLAGTYNFIPTFDLPLLTSEHTVVATLAILYLDSGQLDFYLRAANPQSDPPVNLPKIQLADHSLVPVAMATDPSLPAMQINSGATSQGTIIIDPEPDSIFAPWELVGPGGVYMGNGDRVLMNMAPGSYTITWNSVLTWVGPPAESQNLQAGEVMTLAGAYQQTETETLGLYFDTQGSSNVQTASLFDHVTAYILYNNPSIIRTRGFECGIDLVRRDHASPLSSTMAVSFPLEQVDIGLSNPDLGQYNIIVGYSFPLPTGIHTVLATLDIHYLDNSDVGFFLRPSEPQSDPQDGLPKLIRDDFSLLSLPMASDPDQPALGIIQIQ